MTLQPYQYQLGSVVFGRDTQVPVQKLDINTYNVNAQDFQIQRTDENRFGIDTLVPGPMVFTMSVMNNFEHPSMVGLSDDAFPNESELFAGDNTTLHQLAKEWKNKPLRMAWGEAVPLKFCDKTGQVRRVYGRPGKFQHTPRNKSGEYWVDVQAEFRRADTMSYSDIEYTTPNGGGSVTRLGGDADAWFRVLIYGPATNPVIHYGSEVIETNSTIPSGRIYEISSYPWARRYIDDAVPSVNHRAEIIGNTKYLDQLKFPSGSTMSVSWTGGGGGSQMYFLWREAYNVV